MAGLTDRSRTYPTRTPAPTDWEVRWHPAPGAGTRLFCLPHAGGGSLAYRTWAKVLAPDVEVVAIRLPGRESRFREKPFTCLDELVGTLVKDLAPLLEQPHSWFGHSMGALLAFECARVSRAFGLGGPERLLVSGRPAPHLPQRAKPVHDGTDAELIERLRQNQGTPEEVLRDPVMMAGLLPMVRADYTVTETYAYRAAEALDCPISVFGGSEDPLTLRSELDAWREHSSAGCAVRTYPGGHFYLHEEPLPLTAVLRQELARDGVPRAR